MCTFIELKGDNMLIVASIFRCKLVFTHVLAVMKRLQHYYIVRDGRLVYEDVGIRPIKNGRVMVVVYK